MVSSTNLQLSNIDPLVQQLRDDLSITDDSLNCSQIVDALSNLDADEACRTAGFLVGLGDISDHQKEIVTDLYGTEAINLYNGVIRVANLAHQSTQSGSSQDPAQLEERLRRLLITMIDDVRIVLIAVASHLILLRNFNGESNADAQQYARVGRDIFAPLANMLGLSQLKWELEDYSFRYLNPKAYKTLANALEERRVDREQYIESCISAFQRSLTELNIHAVIEGRAKHIYSIWKKMHYKGLEFRQLWDIRAIRILVDSIDDCYQVLSCIHGNWQPFQNEFVDYIATPKSNGYQSIHTVIKGPQNKALEIQIRTHHMHQYNETGIAAHWRYKARVQGETDIDNKVIWLRQLLDWKNQLISDQQHSGESGQAAVVPVKTEDTRVFVFTPKGTVLDLPAGSTPIDFAYAVHTEIGHRTRGALVNKKMVPLHYVLMNGDHVHIQTVKSGGPSLDWLNKSPSYAITNRARNRISHWFKHQEYDVHVAEGRVMLDKELEKLGLDDVSYDKINQHTHFRKVDDLFAAIGSHDYKVSKALSPFKKRQHETDDKVIVTKAGSELKHDPRQSGFVVEGVGNLLTQIAQCCNPVPGDKIIGYITVGKGISIHRKSCKNVTDLDQEYADRLIEVDWGGDKPERYAAEIKVTGYQRNGLLHDITESLKSVNADILKANMETDDEQIARINMRLDVPGSVNMDQLTQRLRTIPNIYEVNRS